MDGIIRIRELHASSSELPIRVAIRINHFIRNDIRTLRRPLSAQTHFIHPNDRIPADERQPVVTFVDHNLKRLFKKRLSP
ncbi:hypothetical protein D3C74_476030 [compost metagenome]